MTNFTRVLLSAFTLLFLTACSSPKGYMNSANYKTLNKALYDNSFPQMIEDDGGTDDPVFKAAFNSDESYLQKYEALNALALKQMSLEELCTPNTLDAIENFLSVSPIHLHLTFVTYTCAKIDNDEERIARTQQAFQRVVQFIQQSGSGLTPNDPIQLTDYQDIELLNYVTETSILGVDIQLRSNGTFIKAHTFDRAYQRFEYRYYGMSKYLQSKIAPLTGELAPVNVLNMLREASLHPKDSNIGLVLRGKQQFQQGKYEFVTAVLDNAITKLEKANKQQTSYFDNTPLLVTLYFQALLAENKLETFDNNISRLEAITTQGSIEAMALLSLRELFNDTPDVSIIQKNMDEIAYIYEQESAEVVLLSLLMAQPNYQQLLTTWLGDSPSTEQLNAVLELSRRYKFGQVDYFDSQKMLALIESVKDTNVDGVKTQLAFKARFFNANGPDYAKEQRLYDEAAKETLNPEYKAEAMYQLADIYFYGNPSVAVDQQKARLFYEQAAKTGHMQAAYNLATHYTNQVYPSLSKHYVSELLRQATPIRPDAFCMLGDLLKADDRQAAKAAYIEGAKRQQPRCAYALGVLEIQAENYTLAGYWFRKSARVDYLPAIEQLANLYQHGKGTDVNLDKAMVLRDYYNAVPFE